MKLRRGSVDVAEINSIINNMSANNQIIINKKNFKVYHIDVDCGLREDDLIDQGKDMDEAVEIYENWKKEREEEYGWYEIEYGIRFI